MLKINISVLTYRQHLFKHFSVRIIKSNQIYLRQKQ